MSEVKLQRVDNYWKIYMPDNPIPLVTASERLALERVFDGMRVLLKFY